MIDTGFNGYLTLPPLLVSELGLSVVGDGEAVLADGSETLFDIYGITVLWDGQPRLIEAGAAGVNPLVGMSLLNSHDLDVEVVVGGSVFIRAMA